MANYTWSRSIDDGGTFRSGYDIPAAQRTHRVLTIYPNLTQNVISTGSSAFASAVEKKPALSEVEWDPCISPCRCLF